jgi:hypothetical protein
MTPKLLFTLICDDARIEKSNKLIIIGLYNHAINFESRLVDKVRGFQRLAQHAELRGPLGSTTAQPPEQPRPQFALPQLCLVRRWHVDSPGHKAHTELIGPEGKVYATVETELPNPSGDDYCQEIVQFAGLVLIPGEYKIVTKFDSLEHTEQFVVRVLERH